MAKLNDVANFFIAIAGDMADAGLGDAMTNLRLQKILYYAQGWSLARNGKPLFDEPIEAWQYGPVVPAAYEWYKNSGRGVLSAKMPSASAFTTEEMELLTDAFAELDQYSTSALVSMTHGADTPWSSARESGKRKTISNEDIRQYFLNHPLLTFKEKVSRIPIVEPLRYENGVPVFAAEEAWNYD